MKKRGSLFSTQMFFLAVFFFVVSPAAATKPGESVNPNGFPSGSHYNLNIHGKKDAFSCPTQEYYLRVDSCGCGEHLVGDLVEECSENDICSFTNVPIYGNSIFVPENGEGTEIYMQSGKAGGKGKKAEALPQEELWAVDPCAGFDGDGAVIQLPPGEYDVYARALGKPTGDPKMAVFGGLTVVEDEFGNNLVYLGLLTESGFAKDAETFTRSKGKSTAIPITGLFEWTGTVCYFDDLGDPTAFDYNTSFCCYPADPVDGAYDYCCSDANGDGIYDYTECSGDLSSFEPGLCGEITTYCNSYTEEWIFNVADFVEYLWEVNNQGVKLLQVRFYPR